MSIRSPDINADYLQFRNIEIVRGDTFGLEVRALIGGAPAVLTESSAVTFAIFSAGRNPVIFKKYTSESANQDEDGYINVYLTPEETATLKASERYTHELEWLINDDTIYTLLKGAVTVISDKITDVNRRGGNG